MGGSRGGMLSPLRCPRVCVAQQVSFPKPVGLLHATPATVEVTSPSKSSLPSVDCLATTWHHRPGPVARLRQAAAHSLPLGSNTRHETSTRQARLAVLKKDEARCMATKFAKLPGLLRRKDWGRKTGRSVTANLANRSASEDEDRAMDYTPKNMDAVWTSLGAREEVSAKRPTS